MTRYIKDGYHEENVGWKMDNAKIIVKNRDWSNVIISSSSRSGYYFEKD